MIIRDATLDDAGTIAAIWNPVIRDAVFTFNPVEKTPADLVRMMTEKKAAGQAFLVVENDGEVAGFATYGQFRGGQGYARTMEHTIVLGPDTRRGGIGRALLLAVEEHARNTGAHSMIGGISGENPDAVLFHLAMGYREVAVLPDVGFKFGRWMDLHLLQKFL